MRVSTLAVVLAALIAAALIVLGVAQWCWNAGTRAMAARLLSAGGPPRAVVYDEAEIADLPAPVARYFRAVLRDGQPIVQRARVSWRGEFNLGRPGQDRWAPFTAEQLFVPGAPGFVWDARIPMAPGVGVRVRDSFAGGEGAMLAKLAGLFTLADSRGSPGIAAAALQRYLGEALWFPTALLPSQGVRWQPIDATHARASLAAGATAVSLEIRFGADGLITSAFAPERSFDDGRNPPSLRPWQARALRYAELAGTRVPEAAVVEWLLPEGTYEYWRGRPVAIEYEPAAR